MTNAANFDGQYALPVDYISGLRVVQTGNTTLQIKLGTCIDSTGNTNITLLSAINLNAAVNGKNGLDTGTFQASSVYNVFVISSSLGAEDPATIMSLSATPLLPSGSQYDSYRLVGHAFSDGSTHFIPVLMLGDNNFRKYRFTSAISVLSGGSATTLTSIGNLSGIIPVTPNQMDVLLNVDFTPATANDKVSLFPGQSGATVGAHVTGSVAAKVNSGQLMVQAQLVSNAQTILYINSAGSGSTNVWVQGFDCFL